MTILLAVLSIIGTSLAFHRAAEWWSRREVIRPRFSSAAVATWDLGRGTGVKELLDGVHQDAAAVVQRGRAAAWDVEGARIVNGRIENQLRANGYFPTPIDPLHTERLIDDKAVAFFQSIIDGNRYNFEYSEKEVAALKEVLRLRSKDVQ